MAETFSTNSKNVFDLIVIGAGINGGAIARDAAMRGLSVLVLDKGDVACGTSSWSTRLIHGGLRYLEHGELHLVRESLRERETLLRIAPHLVKPLPILVPIYKTGKRGKTTLRAGMIAYDLLSFDKKLKRHRMLSPAEALAKVGTLNPRQLTGAALFYDAQVEFAERLVLENVLAARTAGALVFTYVRVTRLQLHERRVSGVEFENSEDGKTFVAYAPVVVNATGPWVDLLLHRDRPKAERLIGPTKGSHIVVRPFAGAPSNAVYVEAESDHRPFFIIPWNGNLLIGTTDIRFEDDPDEVRSEIWEVDYLLAETNRVFPSAQLHRAQVLYTYSGVRPLPSSNNNDEQTITRRHFIREDPQCANLLSIVGGKLTTHRSLAEECVNLIFHKLGRLCPPCRTANVSLPGAADLTNRSQEFLTASPFSDRVNRRLLRIYGSRSNEMLSLVLKEKALGRVFNSGEDAIAAEIVFNFENELAQTLADCLLRRTMIGLNPDLAIGDDLKAAAIGREFLGWSKDRAQKEVERYRSFVKKMLLPPEEGTT